MAESDKKLHNWGMTILEDGVAARRPWEGVWWENIATFAGDFWAEWDVHRRKLVEPQEKSPHRVRLTVNVAQAVVRTELAKLVKNRPIADPIPKSKDRKDLNAAKTADQILNKYAEKKFHLPRVRRRALHWMLMTGYGGVFIDYDESAQEPIVVAQHEGETVPGVQQLDQLREEGADIDQVKLTQGELRIVPLSPFQLIWDFSQNYIEDAWWVLISETYDVEIARDRWNVKDLEADEEARPGVIEQRFLSRADLSGSLESKSPDSQELTKIHRLFVKPNHPKFPDGLELVFDKNRTISKENFPYGHGMLPLATMGHVPLPTGQFPMSILQQVRDVSLELSRTDSQIIENRNMIGNPMWREPTQSNVEGEIQNIPGGRLKYRHHPNVPPPEPIEMPEMPQYIQNLSEHLKQMVVEIAGQGETSQGRVPPGARSGVAIAYLQEEDDTRLGPTVSEFEEMWERAAYLILETIAEKYDVPRTVSLYKKGSEPEVIDFQGVMIEGNTAVEVQAGSALPRSKAAKQQFMLDLWDRRLIQDPRKVREMLELSEGDPDEWEVDVEQAERENRKLLEGDEVPVADWHNHIAHLYQHRSVMKSADFESKPEEIQLLVTSHHDEHEEADKRKRMEAELESARAAQAGADTGEQLELGSQNGQPPLGSVEAAGEGQQVPEGAPPQFSSELGPRSLLDLEAE